MSLSPAPASTESPLFARTYAVRLGLVLLVAFAAIIAFNGYDESRREQLETFEEVTGVGDRSLFQVPVPAPHPPVAAAVFQGKSLVPVSYKTVEVRDSKMVRAGMADDASLRIYVPLEPLPLEDAEEPGQPLYFLKVARDEYLRVRPAK